MRYLAGIVVAVLLMEQGSLVHAQHAEAPKDAHAPAKGHDAHAPATRSVMEWQWETAIWTVVIFVVLFLVLRKAAWGPILEGMKKREQTIADSIEEAKRLRDENARSMSQFQAKLDAAHAEIPRLMEEARRDAAALKEQMRNDANAEIQRERQRLLREIDVAQDQALQEIWNQAAQLATLISAKAIGRSLSVEDHRRLIDEAMAEMKQNVR